MANYKQEIGQQGEDKAVEYLNKNGYKIVDRNFRTRFGELDIIASENNDIVFVEVKTRTDGSYGSAQEAVDRKKRLKLAKMALLYVKFKGHKDKNFRFDILAINYNDIEIIKNAFMIKRGFFY